MPHKSDRSDIDIDVGLYSKDVQLTLLSKAHLCIDGMQQRAEGVAHEVVGARPAAGHQLQHRALHPPFALL